jgi:hypothetical protein
MTYDKTDSPANATRFFDVGSKLVLKRLAEKFEKAQREEAEMKCWIKHSLSVLIESLQRYSRI